MTRLGLIFCLVLTVLAAPAEARRKSRKLAETKTSESPSPSPSPAPSGGALQKILVAEDQRISRDPFLLSSIYHPSSKIALAALTALGRIGDPAAIEPIARLLNRKDRELKKAAAFALGLISDPTALKVLVQNVPMQKDPEVIAALLLSVGRSGNEQSVNTIAAQIKEGADKKVIEAACHALGTLWSGGSEKWAVPPGLLAQLAELAKQPEPIGLSAAFALARFKGDATLLPADALVDASQKTPSSDGRALLCRALAKLKSPAATHSLAVLVANETHGGTRIEAIKALGQHTLNDETLGAYKKALGDSWPAMLVQSLESAGSHGINAVALVEAVDGLYKTHSSIWVKSTALKTLAKINPVLGRQRAQEVLNAPGSPVLPAAVGALAILGNGDDLEKIVPFLNAQDTRVAVEALEGVSGLPEEKFSSAMKTALKQAVSRADTAVTSLSAQVAEKFRWKEFAPSLASVYPLFTAPDQVEAKVAVLTAIGAVGDRSHMMLLEEAMKEPERLVVKAAVEAYKVITGIDHSAKIPLNSKIIATPPSWSEAMAATRTKVQLITSKGEIQIRLLEETPLNALNFVRLVKQSALKQTFYDGKTFHRVVPNFVVQGGDPRGDGYGGPGYLVRDEVSNRVHTRGTVGLATAGKDTGGCQFFINLAPNLHLDGRYTLFGEVTKGMDVAEKLEVGDRIVSAKILK